MGLCQPLVGIRGQDPPSLTVAVPRALTSPWKTQSVRPWDPAAQLVGVHPKETHTQNMRERSSNVHSNLIGDGGIPRPSQMEEGTKEIGRKHTGRTAQLWGGRRIYPQ